MQRSFLRLLVLAGIFLVPIRSDADITSNLAAWYKLDEASGTTASDSAGSNTGTLNGNASWATGKIKTGVAADADDLVDGVEDYVGCGGILSGSKTAFTVAFWGYRSAANRALYCGWSTLSAHRSRGLLASSDGKIYLYADDADSNDHYNTVAFSGTGWHHFCAVYDGNQSANADRIKCYVDGVLQSVSGTVGTLPSSIDTSGTFRFGVNYLATGNGYYSTGRFDEVRVYDRALSSDDVSQLYGYPAANRSIQHSKQQF